MILADEGLTSAEAATSEAIQADLERLFAGWLARGFSPSTVVPFAFALTAALAKHGGVQYASAIDVLRTIWFGNETN